MTVSHAHTKVFVSGNLNERDKIHDIILKLQAVCEVTYDWTIHEDLSLINNPVYIKSQTILVERGITSADYLIAILDTEPNVNVSNIWTEIGMAIGFDIPVLVYTTSALTHNLRTNLYASHPNIKIFDNMNDIVYYLE